MTIKASDVKALRDATGAGMMDAKRALEEAAGDVEAAKRILREKGIAKAGKLAERSAEEGVVATAARGGMAALVEINCGTDFVAKTDRFREIATRVAEIVAETAPADVDALLGLPADGGTVSDLLAAAQAELGEPVRVRRLAAYRAEGGFVDVYLHQPDASMPPKVGVILDLALEGGDAGAARGTAREIAMQVAAMRPAYVAREEVPEEEAAKERDLIENEARGSGKPDNVIPKIVEGRMRDFYAQIVLLDQPYVRDDKQTVAKFLEVASKEFGGKISVRRFARFRVGGE